MKIIYVASPYRSNTEWGLIENIRRAESVAIELWKKGWAVICPHKNTAYFGGILPDETWLKGDLEIIKRCDAIFIVTKSLSAGMIKEINLAKQINIPIYYKLHKVPEEK